jgi:hypothetical protein
MSTWNEILKRWNLLLLHLRLIIEGSENSRIWHLRGSRWFDRLLLNINILTLSFHLHFLLKFVLLSVFFKLLFVKCLWKINCLFSLRFIRDCSLVLCFFFHKRLRLNLFRLGFFDNLRFFFFNRDLCFLLDDFRFAFNWLCFYNSRLLTTKECTPIITRLLLWLLRSLLE